MTDARVRPGQVSGRRKDNLDLWLNIAVAGLIVLILAGVAWFGYSYYRDKQTNLASSAAGRLVALLTDQVRKNPNDAVLRVRLGESLASMKKYNEATEQLNAALKIEPKHIGANLDLGLIAMMTENTTAAESYFRKVVELTDSSQYAALDSTRETALFNLGLIALEKKRYEDAAGFLKASLAIRKDASDTYYQLAKALDGMGETDGAIEQLMIGVKFDPGFAQAQYFLGELYKKNSDDVNASYAFMRAFELEPTADEPRKAIEAFGPASEWITKSRASLAAGDIETALTSILVARNLEAKSLEAAKLHAEILVKRNNLKDALDVYKQALALDPKNAEFQAKIAELEPQVAAVLKQEAAKKSKK